MKKAPQVELKPRKTPVQQRSTASVDAICAATLQVLLAVGKEKLTTTRVAARAGVSVGTLYQYYPNKSSLLQAVLRLHLDKVYTAIERACEQAKGRPLSQMADILVTAFLAAKLENAQTSRALYFISDDVGGAEIARTNAERGTRALAAMLKTAPEQLRGDPETIALMMFSAMAGVSRRMIEAGKLSPKDMESMREEMLVLVRAYLQAQVTQ